MVVREYSGRVHSPPLIFSRFADCKPLIKRGKDAGDFCVRGSAEQRGYSYSTVRGRLRASPGPMSAEVAEEDGVVC